MKADMLARHSALYLAGRTIPALLAFAAIPVFVRLLGEEAYGRYALVMVLALLAGNASSGWLMQAILRYHSRFTSEGALGRYRSALRLSTLYAVGAGAGAVLLLAVLLLEVSALLLAMIVFIVAAQIVYAIRMTLCQARLQAGRVAAGEITRTAVMLGLPLIWLLFFGEGDYMLLLVGVAGGNLAGLFVVRAGAAEGEAEMSHRHTARLVRRFATFGLPLAGWLGVVSALVVVDRYLIERHLDVAMVGIYAALYDAIFKSLNLVLSPVGMASHPMIMKAWNERDRPGARALIHWTLRMQLLLSVPVLLAAWAGSDLLVRLIFGRADAMAAGIVLPLAVAAVLWQVATVMNKAFELHERTLQMLGYAVLALASNVVLNLLFIPSFGYPAAAFVAAASAAVYLGVTYATAPST